MRLTINNIRFVKELTYRGITYGWYVAMKSNCVGDGRMFCYYTKDGYTDLNRVYPIERLPETVKKYIAHTKRDLFSKTELSVYFIYH